MVKDEVLTVKEAVHKLQLFLLEGIKHANQLSASASLISRSDYQDVVTERKIGKMCGYPLCSKSLPSERPWKGRYRVSLKEHKVYDLQETYMYCSSSCLINSRAFAGTLQEERSSTMNPVKLNEILKLFNDLSLDSVLDMGKNGDLGISKLKIQEKTEIEAGEVPLEEWIGPSNAIDGYVPRRDRNLKPPKSCNLEKGVRQELAECKPRNAQPDLVDIMCNEMNFTIITEDEYSVSKTGVKAKESKGKVTIKGKNDHGKVNIQDTRSKKFNKCKNNVTAANDKLRLFDDPPAPSEIVLGTNATGEKEICLVKKSADGSTGLKSSLKYSVSKNATRSVTWADGKSDGDGQDLCEYAEFEDRKGAVVTSHSTDKEVGEESYRFESVEACARGLSQAAEDVASGKSYVSDALSEAGITILPSSREVDLAKFPESGDVMDGDVTDTDPVLLKWPPKPGFSEADLLDSADSLYDSPPEGFNLNLSPFSTMFMALFAWLSSSSLAYIYGRDESFHEDYLSVNGREYPCKIVAPEGRSSEIKQTLAGCLSRALPGLVRELRLPIPISTLEQKMGRLVDTMSFIDPLPAFRMKEWQVIVLLFLDALSVSRIPALAQHVMGRRIWLPKILEDARISPEEFEIMNDLIIPLGLTPQTSTHNGE